MRKWSQLKTMRQKVRRVWHAVLDFLVYDVWGSRHNRGISRFLYWLRTHTYDRYHIINVKGQGDYRWGWCDRDHLMFLACFKLLVQFVEEEMDQVDWEWNPDHQAAGKELRELAYWWKHGRAYEHKQVDEICDTWHIECSRAEYDHPLWKKYREESDRLERKDDEMLERLMKVRKYMWT